MTDRVESIFESRSVAVIGASRDVSSMSGTLVANLVASYAGPLYLINPKAAEVAGRPAYPSILAAPGPIDLAFVAVPAVHVPRAIDECLAKSVRAIVIITAGFAEVGAAGRSLEQSLLARLRAAGVTMVGPNCLGVLNSDPARGLNGTFSFAAPPVGNVGVCTQSGALGFVFPDYMRRWRIGLAQLISLGNKADVGENDILEHWLREPRVEVAQLYVESFQQPRRFIDVARRLGRFKPVVALKAGRGVAGQRAAGSHTAALASPTALADATLRQAGVLAVEHLPDLFDVTALLAMQPLPRGRRVAVLTNAGGPGVLCADALEAAGLVAPPFSASLRDELARLVPAEASVANPIDLIGSTSPDEYAACLERLLASDEIDSVIAIYVPRLAGTSAAVARAISRTVARAATTGPIDAAHVDAAHAGHAPKTVTAVFLESAAPPAELGEGPIRIPAFEFPERAARALALVETYARWREVPDADVLQPAIGVTALDASAPGSADSNEATVGRRERLRRAIRAVGERFPAGGWLDVAAVHEILDALDLATPRWQVVRTVDELADLMRAWNEPVTLKAVSPSVLHKARAGGVINDVRRVDEAAGAFQRLQRVAEDVTGVLVQTFVRGGLEAIVGFQRHAMHGPVVALGRGGTHVERDRAVALRTLPLTRHDLLSLLRESSLDEVLRGSSGGASGETASGSSGDQETNDSASGALEELVRAMADLACEWPELAEVDWNPVKLFPDRVPCVVDARMRFVVP